MKKSVKKISKYDKITIPAHNMGRGDILKWVEDFLKQGQSFTLDFDVKEAEKREKDQNDAYMASLRDRYPFIDELSDTLTEATENGVDVNLDT